ncbi:SDR family NAD(P)-dependent oxidoreductase [Cohnella zeiphila]|uniref:Glucose 1-dehydrogenase n=1 Tax=Cohnella zeiphila TaxID=2761120 RepID=A0A7X0VWU0_9BACL|nr:glucose 1-dehydrogenase [Cohnella zeiphila]MBB6732757.1 glucose 1-dehydrogenase [Cohnella zeiphila]
MGNRLAGKVVVITGATKGIGKGIAKMCAAEGALAVVSGRNEQDGMQVVRDIKETLGTDALFVKTDVSRIDDCRILIERTVEHFGRIDGLVNNAGIFPRGDLLDTTEELFDAVFNVNIKGAFFCSQYAMKAMSRTGGGSIVQIGSTNAYKGQKDLAAYSCSKGAMLTLSKHIAGNYSEQGIRCNWITVGWVATDGEIELHNRMGVSADRLNEMGKVAIPSGRLQTAEDNAYGVIYLLSDESSQVTGTELVITGGHRI